MSKNKNKSSTELHVRLSKCHKIPASVFSDPKLISLKNAQNPFKYKLPELVFKANGSLTLCQPILLKLTYLLHQLPHFPPNSTKIYIKKNSLDRLT